MKTPPKTEGYVLIKESDQVLVISGFISMVMIAVTIFVLMIFGYKLGHNYTEEMLLKEEIKQLQQYRFKEWIKESYTGCQERK